MIYELAENAQIGLKEIEELEDFFKELFQIENIDLMNSKYLNPIIKEEIKKTENMYEKKNITYVLIILESIEKIYRYSFPILFVN